MSIVTKVVIFLLLSLNLSLFSQWNIIDSGTTEDLNAITFSNSNNGVIVGDDGVILHSTDCGESWEIRESGTWEDFYDVMFPVENIGYAVGKHGIIYKTEDFGMTWNFIDTGFYEKLYSVFFTDENIGYSVGRYGFIIKTLDGGDNWEVIDTGTDESLQDIYFVNNDIGFIVSNGSTILKTENGGVDWYDISLQGSNSWERIHFIDENIGYIIGRRVYKTVNSGKKWFALDIPYPTNDIYFISEEIAFRYSYYNIIEKTVDCGLYWSKELYPSENERNSIYFLDDNIGFMVGESGSIIKTINGGGNHFTGSSPSNDKIFQTDETCMILWETDILDDFSMNIDLYQSGELVMNIATGIVTHNSKGKFKWMIPEIETNSSDFKIVISTSEVDLVPLEIDLTLLQETDIRFYRHDLPNELSEVRVDYMQVYNDMLWLCGSNGTVAFSSDDDFENWTIVNNGIPETEHLSWMDQLDTDIFIIGSYSGKIYRTIDSGLNWNLVFYDPSITEYITYIKAFPETGEVIVVGYGSWYTSTSAILFSDDYGMTWRNNNDYILGMISSLEIIFDSPTTGYILANTDPVMPTINYEIHKTSDFGITWSEINPFSPDIKSIVSISFNGDIGIAICELISFIKIAITRDGGENWHVNLIEGVEGPISILDDNKVMKSGSYDFQFIEFDDSGEIIDSKKIYHPNYLGHYSFFDSERNGFICSGDRYYYEDGWFSSTIPPRAIENNNNNEIEITEYELFQNYPNPFNPNTTIKFDIPRESNIDLKIYNVKGELVQTLIDKRNFEPGTHEIRFNANKLTSGQYFYELKAENSIIATKKMLFLK